MSTLIQDVALLAAAPAAVSMGAAALHYRRKASAQLARNRALEVRARDAEQRVAARDEEAQRLCAVRLPALVNALDRGDGGSFIDAGLLHPQLAETQTGAAHQAVLQQVSSLAWEASERAEGASRAAVQAVVRSLQSLMNEQQIAVTALLESQHDERTLQLAIPIDHSGSQLARRAQVVGVLTGMWPGRQRDDAPLMDAVRGGVSRIRDYQRVRITGERTEQVAGRVVEPVVLAVAELLDNAARHSEPGTMVDVWYIEAHNGISIVIEDAGIGLSPEERERASRLLSGRTPVRLTELRTPPRFGFQAIGLLAARYGFHVSVEQQSVHGGVRAVLHLPRALLAVPTAAQSVASSTGELAHAAASPDPIGQAYPVAGDGLPVRRRGTGPGFQPSAPGAVPPAAGAGRSLAAFVRGTASARSKSSEQEPTA
ncbi:ATP-binding protein [Streptomyces sp. NPDC047023]|uniref:ATP-binding protein n=1 Tax=Streptomyces sp. NPDC047023 TaxID=3155139 RepID=UPI0033E100BD